MQLRTIKKHLFNRFNSSKIHSSWVYWTLGRKIEKATELQSPAFKEHIRFENARKRLKSVSVKTHPQNHFRSKTNQRRFLESIKAPLPAMHYHGPIEGLVDLEDGRYFLKPESGSSAKGTCSIKKLGDTIKAFGIRRKLSEFIAWYTRFSSANDVIAEELLQDRYFKDIIDYKVYCFRGFSTDHVLCIQRTPEKHGATFLPTGKPIDIGRYKTMPLAVRPPIEAIKEVAERADEIARMIPLSFVRLDFYVTTRGVVVGEVTPVPGNASDISLAHNKEMGRKWSIARKRMQETRTKCPGEDYFSRNNILRY